jgi:methylated-DNA-[protein]-cysteine S-methyltransferase
MRQARIDTPIGPLVASADDDGRLSALRFADDNPASPADDAAFAALRAQLDAYFAGDLQRFEVPLAPAGTAWQQAVWTALTQMPYAATSTYAALAARLGRPSAARAVGAANGRNPIAIVVPCHRLVGSTGALTGYAGGLDRKRWLLAHERRSQERHAPLSSA